ncbi:helix-turn-helix domain-containing protein [Curtobacterium sp. MCSS17_011]|uniref:helix-turn-helix domain-containing protein n=1 Tax=Curtobacterium sp. MCSS17_011 TaxID=2175643 RepID=UPI0015E8B887|nr:helix-turn-helix transcriptional regulator [Curtobacterium sp. MCSS17_011]
MSKAVAHLQRALADEVRGASRREGFSQARVAELTGLSLTTIQRLFAGKREMDTTQLTLIAQAIGEQPDALLRAAMSRAERMSEAAPDNVTQLQPRKRVEDMTVEEIEQLDHAATVDPEMDEPEQFD